MTPGGQIIDRIKISFYSLLEKASKRKHRKQRKEERHLTMEMMKNLRKVQVQEFCIRTHKIFKKSLKIHGSNVNFAWKNLIHILS